MPQSSLTAVTAPSRPLDGARRRTSWPRAVRRLGRRLPRAGEGRITAGGPGPGRPVRARRPGAAAAGSGRAEMARRRPIYYLQCDSNISLSTHHASSAAMTRHALHAPRLLGGYHSPRSTHATPVRRQSHATLFTRHASPAAITRHALHTPRQFGGNHTPRSSHATPVRRQSLAHVTLFARLASSAAVSPNSSPPFPRCSHPARGPPLGPWRNGHPEPHRLPGRAAGIRLIPGLAGRLAVDCSSAACSGPLLSSAHWRPGTPPVAQPSRRVGLHAGHMSAASCGQFDRSPERGSLGSGATARRAIPVAWPGRGVPLRHASLAGRRSTTDCREHRSELSSVSSEAPAYRTSPDPLVRRSPSGWASQLRDRCKWRHGAAEAVNRRLRTVTTLHPLGKSRLGGRAPPGPSHAQFRFTFFYSILSFVLDYFAPLSWSEWTSARKFLV
jgi:hypothetical protein